VPEPAQRPARAGAELHILRPGLLTTIQDLGRVGLQCFGMPVSGAMDWFALRAANRLVGNPDGAAALECTVIGPAIRFDHDSVIAITGGDLSPTIDESPAPLWTAIGVRTGSVLAFGARRCGARAYVAVAGGIDVPVVLGSRSTHIRSQTGGLEGRPLREQDRVRVGTPGREVAGLIGRSLPVSVRPRYDPMPQLRMILGPQVDRFTAEAVDRLLAEPYTVSPEADRMGYRLTGAALPHRGPAEIITDATPPGSLQVPPDRQPILLMADHQTTGGYPKIAVVISVDLPLAAQLLPGDQLRFAPVDAVEAGRLIRERVVELDAGLPPGP
jgi:antagonist of KipI